jgi:hypothetical protein
MAGTAQAGRARLTRAAVIREATLFGTGLFGAIQAVAPSLGVEVSPIAPRDADEIDPFAVRGTNLSDRFGFDDRHRTCSLDDLRDSEACPIEQPFVFAPGPFTTACHCISSIGCRPCSTL